MQRLDAHQHFWKYDPSRDSWITDDMAAIRRDFGPEDLQPLLRQHGFDGCVLVQSAEPELENAFLLKQAEQHAFIKGVVGWVDFFSETLEEQLAQYASSVKLKGFRYILQGTEDRALMLRPSFMQGIRKLLQHGFTYDILIFPDQLPYAAQLVAALPDQPFVIDHMAKPYIKAGKITEWKKDMKAVAKYANVSCKVSGMVTEADWQNWKPEDFAPYMDAAVEAFGTDRLMYGSDWPVCLVAATYGEALAIVQEYFSAFSKAEQDAVFGGNAARFYKLS
ncbi:amidohydrolase family protein [Pontibacter saemangeumensis]|uniref:Amidohydrolase family protein n=1 Tax=Pontibacter saemangeumensis TaxID=1084525 RepID=A0ABP8M282_9BACT